MAVITDAGDSLDIHPRNKTVTGERLAAWALAKQYGKDVTYSGPLFKTMKVEGNKAVLSFDYADDGLMTPDNKPVKGFIVAGEDRRFYPATALIRRQTGSFRSAGFRAGSCALCILQFLPRESL